MWLIKILAIIWYLSFDTHITKWQKSHKSNDFGVVVVFADAKAKYCTLCSKNEEKEEEEERRKFIKQLYRQYANITFIVYVILYGIDIRQWKWVWCECIGRCLMLALLL